MQKVKRILLIVIILTILSAQTVSAQEEKGRLQEKEGALEKGSIQIVISEETENIKKDGIKFQCIKVADIVNGKYVFKTEIVREQKLELKEEMTADELNEMAGILAEQNYDSEIKIMNQNGEIIFEDLEIGLYLLKAQSTQKSGRIDSVLIAVPTWDEIQKKMEYNIEVIPKYVQDEEQGVKTGDSQNLVVYYGLMGVSLLFMLYRIGDEFRTKIHRRVLDQ